MNVVPNIGNPSQYSPTNNDAIIKILAVKAVNVLPLLSMGKLKLLRSETIFLVKYLKHQTCQIETDSKIALVGMYVFTMESKNF